MEETKTIQIDNKTFQYTLQRKKMKNIVLKIQPNGGIIVSTNPYVPITKIEAFLSEKLTWILKKQQQKQQQQQIIFESCLVQETLYLNGVAYPLLCVASNKNKVDVEKGNVIVYYKKDKESCDALVRMFLKKQTLLHAQQLVATYVTVLEDYHLESPVIKARTMKTRWGSCATKKGIVTFNTNLIHFPIAFFEYVVLHELVHFIQPNHSKQFYHIIEYYMPDYKQRVELQKGLWQQA